MNNDAKIVAKTNKPMQFGVWMINPENMSEHCEPIMAQFPAGIEVYFDYMLDQISDTEWLAVSENGLAHVTITMDDIDFFVTQETM